MCLGLFVLFRSWDLAFVAGVRFLGVVRRFSSVVRARILLRLRRRASITDQLILVDCLRVRVPNGEDRGVLGLYIFVGR